MYVLRTVVFTVLQQCRGLTFNALQYAMYPYGNAKETQNKDGSWTFQCQHGEKECTGNIIEVKTVKIHGNQYTLNMYIVK